MQDYGCNPLGGGMFEMVPSGDIVNKEEKEKRLKSTKREIKNNCLGLSWEEIEQKQGGKLKR